MNLNPVKLRDDGQVQVWRHWLTMDDGRIFYQDEIIKWEAKELVSTRTGWEQLPTPPQTWDVVGFIDHGGFPLAMLRNGESYLYARSMGENEVARWLPFCDEPVPKTHARAEFEA